MNTKEHFKFIYIYYTIKGFLSLLLILFIILILTPAVLLITIFFDKNRIIYFYGTKIFTRLFFILNLIPIDKYCDFSELKKNHSGNCIYVLNHCSLVDGLIFFLIPDKIRFMAGEFYSKIPIFGLGISIMGNIAIKKMIRQDIWIITLQLRKPLRMDTLWLCFPRDKDPAAEN